MDFLERGMKILMICSYPPRECGIATFSQDIVNVIEKVFGDNLQVEICALQNDNYDFLYPSEVNYKLNVNSIENYRSFGEKINQRTDIGLVCIQHEFGLFGGENGNYLINLLLSLNKPIVTVFHTVLPKPKDKRKSLVSSITDLSEKIVVLTKKSQNILIEDYEINKDKITVIPHGTHMILWQDKELLKKRYFFENKIVLSTFGLLGRNKNIETVLKSLPEIVVKHPNLIYLVIGKTHPELFKNEGDEYREELIQLTKKLKLENNVLFINEFVELKQLLEYLTLSDIYLFSSKDPHQTVSGTLAYALSCGCAVIATPIPHAKEILDGAGILLENFEEPFEFKVAIQELIENKERRIAMSKNAYLLSHQTVWENVAIQFGLLYGNLTSCEDHLRFIPPPIKLDHIKELTTRTGILQFSNFSEPNLSFGYTLDDNARALINMIMYFQNNVNYEAIDLAYIYFNFIEKIQKPDGLFNNYKNSDEELTAQNKEVNLEDANGRAIWSLGFLIANKYILPPDLVYRAEKCWDKAFPNISNITSPRAIAYTIKGLYHYYTLYQNQEIKNEIQILTDKLLQHYKINSSVDWYWYEDYMTYANNVLPEAMMYSYMVTNDERMKEIAIVSFDFLLSHYFMKGELKVISNNGWFKKKNKRAFFGEQPIEVVTTIVALDLFYEITGDLKYRNQIDVAFSWFLGNNHLKQIMYNSINGASYDGLEDTQININQGAESTLCFFKAQMIMEKYKSKNVLEELKIQTYFN
jgi:glycosyltransferase involved in cell wall biosynthesis